MNIRRTPSDAEALQARLGGALAAALSARSAAMPHDITERLRAGREQALARARFKPAAQVASAPMVVGATGGAAVLGGPTGWGWKLFSGVPLLVLVAGLVAIDYLNNRQQVLAAAEIDAMLLADDLPPAAYADPGFGEYLRSPRSDNP